MQLCYSWYNLYAADPPTFPEEVLRVDQQPTPKLHGRSRPINRTYTGPTPKPRSEPQPVFLPKLTSSSPVNSLKPVYFLTPKPCSPRPEPDGP